VLASLAPHSHNVDALSHSISIAMLEMLAAQGQTTQQFVQAVFFVEQNMADGVILVEAKLRNACERL